jgi:hypothetical protein
MRLPLFNPSKRVSVPPLSGDEHWPGDKPSEAAQN